MGFGKKQKPLDEQEEGSTKSSTGRKRRKEKEAEEKVFVASTVEELKGYRRSARKKARMAKKLKKRARLAKPEKIEVLEPIEGLNVKKFVRIFRKVVGEKTEAFKADKKAHWRIAPRMPFYESMGTRSASDAQFVYEMHGKLAHFSWKELKRLLRVCEVEVDNTLFTSTYLIAERALYQALGCEVDKGGVRYVLTDRDATLKLWSVDVKERLEMSKDKSEKKGKKRRDEDEETPKKKSKKEKPEKEEKEPKKGKKSKVKLSDESTVSKLKDRPKGGPKTKLLNLIPRKGISFKKLTSKAKEEGFKSDKVAKWVQLMSKNGFIGIE